LPDITLNKFVALVVFGLMLGCAADAAARQVGSVSSYSAEKGIGFILGRNGDSVSFHKSDWSLMCPAVGVTVTYDLTQRARGLVATGIVVVGGSPAPCAGERATASSVDPAPEDTTEAGESPDPSEGEIDPDQEAVPEAEEESNDDSGETERVDDDAEEESAPESSVEDEEQEE
jgi:cold shock CspA family protein